MARHIIYFGIPDFSIAVERVRDRQLRERPVVMIPSTGARTVIAAASVEARAEGVREGMPLTVARRYCPRMQILLPDPALYRRAMTKVVGVLSQYSPLIEPEGYGHIYLDISGTRRLLGEAKDAGAHMRREIGAQLRLEGDLGLATNKLVSRVAGELAHAGMWDVLPGNEADFLSPLPPWRLPGIGAIGARRLMEELNLRTVGEVSRIDPAYLHMAFGPFGAVLAQRARGIDPRPVLPPARTPTAMAETLLADDTNDALQLDAAVFVLAERLGLYLRTQGKVARNLQLTARFGDGRDFSRSCRLEEPTNLDVELAAALRAPTEKLFGRRVRVRYLRLNATRLDEENRQRGLFGDSPEHERLRALHHALDRLRAKYGQESVTWGQVAQAKAERERGEK